jgi:sec-independent protein translocase protein TatC
MPVRPVGHEDRLSLVEHLDELRSRLITSVLVLVAAFSFTYWQNDEILKIVNKPLESTQNLDGKKRSNDPLEQAARFQVELGRALRALAPALRGTGESLQELSRGDRVPPAARAQVQRRLQALEQATARVQEAAKATPTNRERKPVTLGVAEPFVTTFTVAMYAALLLALPFLLYQAYAFILPAFTPSERRAVLPLMLMVPVLFAAGVTFGYFVALPRAVDFLQNFNDDDFDILLQAKDYYRFNVMFLGMCGLLFQIPVGVLIVTRLGVISTATLRRNRGYVLLALAVVAAVATPTPDPVTMLFALGPLVILFELSVQLARFTEGKPKRGWWNEGDDEEDPPDAEAAGDDEDEPPDADAPGDGGDDPPDAEPSRDSEDDPPPGRGGSAAPGPDALS